MENLTGYWVVANTISINGQPTSLKWVLFHLPCVGGYMNHLRLLRTAAASSTLVQQNGNYIYFPRVSPSLQFLVVIASAFCAGVGNTGLGYSFCLSFENKVLRFLFNISCVTFKLSIGTKNLFIFLYPSTLIL